MPHVKNESKGAIRVGEVVVRVDETKEVDKDALKAMSHKDAGPAANEMFESLNPVDAADVKDDAADDSGDSDKLKKAKVEVKELKEALKEMTKFRDILVSDGEKFKSERDDIRKSHDKLVEENGKLKADAKALAAVGVGAKPATKAKAPAKK